jgi:hypothetical protein
MVGRNPKTPLGISGRSRAKGNNQNPVLWVFYRINVDGPIHVNAGKPSANSGFSASSLQQAKASRVAFVPSDPRGLVPWEKPMIDDLNHQCFALLSAIVLQR